MKLSVEQQLTLYKRERECAQHHLVPVMGATAPPEVAHSVAAVLVEGCYACGVAHVYEPRRDGSLPWTFGYDDLDRVHADDLAAYQQGVV